MSTSIEAVAVGSAVLIGGLFSVLVLLPQVTPYEFVSCTPFEEGKQCSSSLNPIYDIGFLVSMAGSVALFFGVFGRRFVLGPLYVVGTLLMGWGSAGVTFGYLGNQWCASQSLFSCIAYHPESFALAILAGLFLIGGNGLWWRRGLPKRSQIPAEPH